MLRRQRTTHIKPYYYITKKVGMQGGKREFFVTRGARGQGPGARERCGGEGTEVRGQGTLRREGNGGQGTGGSEK